MNPPARTSSPPRSTPADAAAASRPSASCCSRPRATHSSRGCARTSTACARPPVADRPGRARRRAPRRSPPPAALLEQGLLVPAIRPPTVAPGTSRLRVALSAAHTDEQVDALVRRARRRVIGVACRGPRRARRRRRHRHRGRQDVGDGRQLAACSARAAARVARAQAGAVVRARRPAPPTPTCSPRPPATAATTVCPPAPLVRGADGAADGRRRARPAAVHDRRPRRRDRLARRRRRRCSSRAPAACAPRSRDDGDTVDLADAPARPSRRARGRRRAGHDQRACGSRVDALAGITWSSYLNRFDPGDDLHRRNRDWLVTREGLEVVTDPEALADFLLERAQPLMRFGGVMLAVLPSSFCRSPIVLKKPSAVEYCTRLNSSPRNQSSALTVHCRGGELQTRRPSPR